MCFVTHVWPWNRSRSSWLDTESQCPKKIQDTHYYSNTQARSKLIVTDSDTSFSYSNNMQESLFIVTDIFWWCAKSVCRGSGGRRGEGAVGGNVTKTPVKSVVQPSIDWNALVCTAADKPVAEAFQNGCFDLAARCYVLIIITFLFGLLTRHAGTEILRFNTDTDGLLNIILPCTSRLSRRSTAKTLGPSIWPISCNLGSI